MTAGPTMRLVFLGTPAFAVPTLERMWKRGIEVVAVFTQPDRPKGRGQKTAMPPVKEAALRLGLPVHQPERVRRPEVVEQLRALAPEAMVVVGYGQIIPQAILDIPPHGIINVHASLLPKYRGAAPIQWAIAQRRNAHRRDDDADRRGSGYRRHAAEVGNGDRAGGDGGGIGRAAGGGWARICWSRRWRARGRHDRAARSRMTRRRRTRRS